MMLQVLLVLLARIPADLGSSDTALVPGSLVDLDNWPIVDPAKKTPKAICLLFLGAECPVSNALSPELIRIQKEYAPKGAVFAGVYPDPDVDTKRAREHAKEYGLGLPQILDPRLVVARQAKIELTPEAVILDPLGKILWRGRINDLWTPEGKKRLAPTTHDLRLALDAVLGGKAPPPAKGKGYGCPLPELKIPGGKDR